MPGKLLVHRKGYRRRDGTRVKPTTFRIQDIGAPGRGPDTIKVTRPGYLTRLAHRKGLLTGDKQVTDLSQQDMRKLALAAAKSTGALRALHMFQAQINYRARARGASLADRRKFEAGKAAIQRRYFNK